MSRFSSMFRLPIITGLCVIVILAVSIFTSRVNAQAVTADTSISPEEKFFRGQTAYYLYRRSLEFSDEMLLREEFLKWLLQGINQEVSLRRKESPGSALDAINPPELLRLDQEEFLIPADWNQKSVSQRYVIWEQLVSEEYNNKFLKARLIKDRLIKTATPAQLKRMFKNDLTQAFYTYRDRDYRGAIYFYDEVIDRYGYTDIADVVFYRGESYFGIQFFERARNDYNFVVERSGDANLRRKALNKLLVIAGEEGELDEVERLWEQYKKDSQDQDEEYWKTSERTARYLLDGREYHLAQQIFDKIPPSESNYAMSQLLAADCSLRDLNLDDAEQRYFAIIKKRIDGKGLTKDIISEGRLKLAYIDFLRGDYDLAFVNFNAVKDGSRELVERAAIGCCWALYKIGAYDQTIKLCNKFMVDYPESFHLYEAQCLIGYCHEKMNSTEPAIASYIKVMGAIDDRQEYQDFNYERKSVNDLLSQVKQLETRIFLDGRYDLYRDYVEVRQNAGKLMEKIKIAEGLKNSPILAEMMKEQKDIYSILAQQGDFEQQLAESGNFKLMDKYDDAVYDLMDLADQIDMGIRYHLSQKTLIQKEEEQIFSSIQRDTLNSRIEREWIALEKTLSTTRQYIANAKGKDPEILKDLGGLELSLMTLQDKLLDMRREIRDQGEIQLASSDLDHWSDFAYERYTYGGLKFENLFRKQERLQAVDEYIRNVNQLIASRRPVPVDTTVFPEDLMPITAPEHKTYLPPPVPLWDAKKSPIAGEVFQNMEAEPAETVAPDTSGAVEPEMIEEDNTDTMQMEDGQQSETDEDSGSTVMPEDDGSSPDMQENQDNTPAEEPENGSESETKNPEN